MTTVNNSNYSVLY